MYVCIKLIKTLTKDLIDVDLLFASIGEKGRAVPVERIPLEKFLGRIGKQNAKGKKNQGTIKLI